ncbi:GNAT family N-acetyltransferase [Pseudolysinimonas yzui]|uniref:N-acetyltransferase n=1 Tax=Pseudolysinimonas yzui TaxID=2708254 RepID=A0A8J3GQV4_9MICO|nr:GNAT family N-acetyltransferase [Pseudolysinimonas yzui]GHF16392.1 N-acetyltransferase [Pseudolysinimonas yzui]
MITVRPAVPDDAERIADIRLTGWRETYAHLLSAGFLEQMTSNPARIRASIENGTPVVVAEIDGDVVGFACASTPFEDEPDPPRDLQLWFIYQYARAHGSGTGQALLDAVVSDRPAFLWVAEGNPRAIAFYRRNGFTLDGTRKVAPDWENLAEIRMVR